MEKRVLQPDDLLTFAFVGDVQVSPDGDRVAFVKTTIDRESNEYRSRIYVVPAAAETDGAAGDNAAGDNTADESAAEPQPFTGGPKRDHSPRWSPDGRQLAFVSDRSGFAQLWVMPAGGGEAHQITKVKGGVDGPVWSPDGECLAFTARLGPEGIQPEPASAGPGKDVAELEAEELKSKPPAERFTKDVKVIDRIWYRLDTLGYFGDKRSQICVVEAATGRAVQLTDGAMDAEHPAWSPDGRQLAFSSNRLPDGDQHPSIADIHVIPFDPAGFEPSTAGAAAQQRVPTPRTLTASQGAFGHPAWSPDGSRIACLGHNLERGWYTQSRLWLLPAAGGEARCLTEGFDQTFGDQSISDIRGHGGDPAPRWSPDGGTLFMPFSEGGTVQLGAVDVGTGRVTPVTSGDRVHFDLSLDRNCTTLAGAVTDPAEPGDVYVWRVAASSPAAQGPQAPPAPQVPQAQPGAQAPQATAERRLTRCNQALLEAVQIAPVDRFGFHAAGGPEADGWLVHPLGVQPGEKFPAVLEVHGGPMAMYAHGFFLEFQLLAARGIGVVFTNPRGGFGYGQNFVAAIRGDWGNLDYQDVMAGLDAAVARWDIDPTRLGIAGGSYGGFMTNWAIGHTDRFRAAVTMRSVVNEYSFFGTSDLGYTDDEEWDAVPWRDPERYLKQSPIRYVERMHTPLLILHSEEDYRCPISQAEELYASLKKLGQEVVFIRFPGESHELSRSGKPWHRVFRLQRIVDWFAQRL